MTEQGERRINQPRGDQAGEKEWRVGEGRRLRGQLGSQSQLTVVFTHAIRRKHAAINTPRRDVSIVFCLQHKVRRTKAVFHVYSTFAGFQSHTTVYSSLCGKAFS